MTREPITAERLRQIADEIEAAPNCRDTVLDDLRAWADSLEGEAR